MTNEKMNQFGDIQEGFSLELDYSLTKRDGAETIESKIRKVVKLDIGNIKDGGFSFRELRNFQQKANELLAEIKELLYEGTYCEVTFIHSAYEHVEEHEEQTKLGLHKSTLNSVLFDCWRFTGSSLDSSYEDEEGGLYLQPDTRYTRENWDMVWLYNRDIFFNLSEAGF